VATGLNQTARNPNVDFIQATPRNAILGYLADLAAASYSAERTQQLQTLAKFMSAPAISETLDRLSYGMPITTGAGGLGGTTRLRPEALEAGMAIAPMVGPSAKAANAGAMAAGRAGERFAERYVPMVMERGGLGAEMLQGMGRGTVSPMDVYHGSPHTFPPTPRNPLGEFDASKIGAGEGNQAYGQGFYLAESPNVAKGYAEQLSAAQGPLGDVAKYWRKNGGEDAFRSFAKDAGLPPAEIENTADVIRNTGNLYKVDLPDEKIAQMLDFDKPLSQQSKQVKQAIEKTKAMLPSNALDDLGGDLSLMYGPNVMPVDFLNTWESLG
jgi:hypothetical protein